MECVSRMSSSYSPAASAMAPSPLMQSSALGTAIVSQWWLSALMYSESTYEPRKCDGEAVNPMGN
eukprot:6176257-Pleurochrysis_carterae.AAC.1